MTVANLCDHAFLAVVDVDTLKERYNKPFRDRADWVAIAGQGTRIALSGADMVVGLAKGDEETRMGLRSLAFAARLVEAIGEAVAGYRQSRAGKITPLEALEQGILSPIWGIAKASHAVELSDLRNRGADPEILRQKEKIEAESASTEAFFKRRTLSRWLESLGYLPEKAPAQGALQAPDEPSIPESLQDAPELLDYVDPIALQLPVHPVRIRGEKAVYDFSSLEKLLAEAERSGSPAISPFTRKPFTIADVERLPEIQREIYERARIRQLIENAERLSLSARREFDSWNRR